MAGRRRGERGDGESRGKTGGRCKGREGPVGKVKRREEVHRGGSAYYRLRGEEETLEGYTTLKCNTTSQNLGLILEHRSALGRREKKKKKKANCTLWSHMSALSCQPCLVHHLRGNIPPKNTQKATLHPILDSVFPCHVEWYYSDWGKQELTYGCRKPPPRDAEGAHRFWLPSRNLFMPLRHVLWTSRAVEFDEMKLVGDSGRGPETSTRQQRLFVPLRHSLA